MDPHQSTTNGVVITLSHVYDQLVTLTREVSGLSGKLDRAVNDHQHTREDVTDHEARIRSVERRVWAIPSAATVVALVALLLPLLGVGS